MNKRVGDNSTMVKRKSLRPLYFWFSRTLLLSIKFLKKLIASSDIATNKDESTAIRHTSLF